jgi:uncharacterized membrane protein YecN with MAPEG domain
MRLVAIVAGLALVEYSIFLLRAGQARGRYGVPAPATTGNQDFERHLRVQENTIEQLVIFLPSIFLFAHFVSEPLAAAIGVVFLVGRALYARAYVRDPAGRGPGFLLSFASNLVLLVGAIVGAALGYL